jgi:hypothetical protein
MEGEAAALVFEQDAIVPRCEVGDQRAESIELRMRGATDHVSVATAPLEAMVSGDPTRERGEHVGKLIERPATHHGESTTEPVSQLA